MTNYIKIKNLKDKEKGKYLIKAFIKAVRQTKGPTIFTIEDETGSINIIGFKKPGERAFEEIKKDMFVEVEVNVEYNESRKNLVIKNIFELNPAEYEQYKQNKEKELLKLIELKDNSLLLNTKTMNKLNETISKIAFEIRKAVIDRRPIFLKYHKDLDGYTSATLLEIAINEYNKKTFNHNDAWFVSKSPMKTPFYTLSETLKDLSFIDKNSRYNIKKPLIVLLDNGSGMEDYYSLQPFNLEGIDIIVIDHHIPYNVNNKDMLSELVKYHLNPYLIDSDKNINTSLLSLELSNRVVDEFYSLFNNITHNTFNVYDFAYLGCIGDKSESEEVEILQTNLSLSYNRLYKVAKVLDYHIFNLVTSDESTLLNMLIKDAEEDYNYVEVMYDFLQKKNKILIDLFGKYSEKYIGDENELYMFNFSDNTLKYEYPPLGKASGIILEDIMKTNEDISRKNIYVILYSEDSITIRIRPKYRKDIKGLKNLYRIMDELSGRYTIEGGGHDVAGTIRVIKSELTSILEDIKEFIVD